MFPRFFSLTLPALLYTESPRTIPRTVTQVTQLGINMLLSRIRKQCYSLLARYIARYVVLIDSRLRTTVIAKYRHHNLGSTLCFNSAKIAKSFYTLLIWRHIVPLRMNRLTINIGLPQSVEAEPWLLGDAIASKHTGNEIHLSSRSRTYSYFSNSNVLYLRELELVSVLESKCLNLSSCFSYVLKTDSLESPLCLIGNRQKVCNLFTICHDFYIICSLKGVECLSYQRKNNPQHFCWGYCVCYFCFSSTSARRQQVLE